MAVPGREPCLKEVCGKTVNPREIHGKTCKDFEKFISGSIISLDQKDKNSQNENYQGP